MKLMQNEVLNLAFMSFLENLVFRLERAKFGPKSDFSFFEKNCRPEIFSLNKLQYYVNLRLT